MFTCLKSMTISIFYVVWLFGLDRIPPVITVYQFQSLFKCVKNRNHPVAYFRR